MKTRRFVGDFETTVYEGQTYTEVWASALVEIGSEDVKVFHSIDETFDYLVSLKQSVMIYYHNLKFDGEFWLWFLLKKKGFTQAAHIDTEHPNNTTWMQKKDMPRNSVSYRISARGQWYNIVIHVGKYYIEIRDSLKLLPFSVKQIGKSFKTKHQKLDMEYKGLRYAGCEITPEEEEYIKNDVLVVKEALEIMFEEGHDSLTIGSCALTEFKKLTGKDWFDRYFPNVANMELNVAEYGSENVDEYIRRAYKGGWCYAVPEKTNRILKNGITLDVNSLYPSVMSMGYKYPVSRPHFWKGNFIPDKALMHNHYYFIRIRTRFYLKKGYLPFLQIKGNLWYDRNTCLTTSDYYDKKTGTYHRFLLDADGNDKPVRPTITLTCTDYILFMEHYDVEDFEILDGCWFGTEDHIFDMYIRKYKKLKQESTGARRQLAKLFLNSLYGKTATNSDSSFKLAFDKSDTELGFIPIMQFLKDPVYIPIGAAICSFARNFTVRAAQRNYHGPIKPGFVYADTDSIHCDFDLKSVKGVKIDDKEFGCWKCETHWDEAIFVRPKTYIEHVVIEDEKPCEPYYNIKCAGMPDRCKELFNSTLIGRIYTEEEKMKLSPEEIAFLFDDDGNTVRRTLEDFKIGLNVPSKLMPKRIPGGVILVDKDYTMRPKGVHNGLYNEERVPEDDDSTGCADESLWF